MLRIAEKFGRPPEEVEKWEPYWFNRAAIYLATQDELDRMAMQKDKPTAPQRPSRRR